MARIRSIKPELFTSEDVAELPVEARWTFVGLLTYVDDQGRGKADPRLVKAAVWPLDDDVSSAQVEGHLDALERGGQICRYDAEGRRFLHIVAWHHQKIDHPSKQRHPACPRDEHGGPPEPSRVTREKLASPPEDDANARETFSDDQGTGNREQGGEQGVAAPSRLDVERLCTHLADRIEANGSKRPSITQGWRDAARLMLDRDKRAEDQVHAAIDWCQDHDFWRSNVLSMPKLREKFDQLRLQAQRDGPQRSRRQLERDEWRQRQVEIARNMEEASQ